MKSIIITFTDGTVKEFKCQRPEDRIQKPVIFWDGWTTVTYEHGNTFSCPLSQIKQIEIIEGGVWGSP